MCNGIICAEWNDYNDVGRWDVLLNLRHLSPCMRFVGKDWWSFILSCMFVRWRLDDATAYSTTAGHPTASQPTAYVAVAPSLSKSATAASSR